MTSFHHDTAIEPGSWGRADGDVPGGGRGVITAELSVAEKRGEHHRCNGCHLHDTGNDPG